MCLHVTLFSFKLLFRSHARRCRTSLAFISASMPSISLTQWRVDGRRALDQMEAAHRAIGRTGSGARYAAEQINQAYVLLVSSWFQRFCRDLHTECIDHLVRGLAPLPIQIVFRRQLEMGRKLDTGNPNPGNIGSDFDRFEIRFWPALVAHDERNTARQRLLASLNNWRNAIAHQDFSSRGLLERNRVRLLDVRRWRTNCEHLAVDFERVMYHYLRSLTGSTPW